MKLAMKQAYENSHCSQAALLVVALSLLAFTAIRGYNGFSMFVWIYGIFMGGYNYALKMYVYEKVRARNFARAWGFAQCAMAIPILIGVPLSGQPFFPSMISAILFQNGSSMVTQFFTIFCSLVMGYADICACFSQIGSSS